MSLPMAGNGILISPGDFRAAGRLMVIGTRLNAILDPILIFGFPGLPAMGIRGAALLVPLSFLGVHLGGVQGPIPQQAGCSYPAPDSDELASQGRYAA